MEKHWYSPTTGTNYVAQKGTNGADSNHMSYWFDGDGNGNRTATHSLSAPQSGDVLYFDQGTPYFQDAHSECNTWSGVRVKCIGASQTITVTGDGVFFVVDADCLFDAGISLYSAAGVRMFIAATWLGDINVYGGDGVTLSAGWRARNGSPGGNVSLTTRDGEDITVYAPASGQGSIHNMSLTTAGDGSILLSAIGTIVLTGTFTVVAPQGPVTYPSTTWLTLAATGASAFGVIAGATGGDGPNNVLVI